MPKYAVQLPNGQPFSFESPDMLSPAQVDEVVAHAHGVVSAPETGHEIQIGSVPPLFGSTPEEDQYHVNAIANVVRGNSIVDPTGLGRNNPSFGVDQHPFDSENILGYVKNIFSPANQLTLPEAKTLGIPPAAAYLQQGTAQGAQAALDPQNLPLLAGSAALSATGVPELGLIAKALQAFFTGSMLSEGAKDIGTGAGTLSTGDKSGLRDIGKGAVTGGMGAMGVNTAEFPVTKYGRAMQMITDLLDNPPGTRLSAVQPAVPVERQTWLPQGLPLTSQETVLPVDVNDAMTKLRGNGIIASMLDAAKEISRSRQPIEEPTVATKPPVQPSGGEVSFRGSPVPNMRQQANVPETKPPIELPAEVRSVDDIVTSKDRYALQQRAQELERVANKTVPDAALDTNNDLLRLTRSRLVELQSGKPNPELETLRQSIKPPEPTESKVNPREPIQAEIVPDNGKQITGPAVRMAPPTPREPGAAKFIQDLEGDRPFILSSPRELVNRFTMGRDISTLQMKNTLRNKQPAEYRVLEDSGAFEGLPDAMKVEDFAKHIADKGPKAEVKRAVMSDPKAGNEVDRLKHEVETNRGYSIINGEGGISFIDPVTDKETLYKAEDVPNERVRNLALRYREAYRRYDPSVGNRDGIRGSTSWQSISPKSEADMPGYTEIAVVAHPKPHESIFAKNTATVKFASSHNFPANTLVFNRGFMETLPDGRKRWHVIEQQSDWAQRLRKYEEDAKQGRSPTTQAGKDLMQRMSDPLLNHYNELGLKAAIAHAKKEGASSIVIHDAETAMMTEGHDAHASENFRKFTSRDDAQAYIDKRTAQDAQYENRVQPMQIIKDGENVYRVVGKIDQEGGMRLHYDQILPRIAKDLTGSEGTRVEAGEHRMASKPVSQQTGAMQTYAPTYYVEGSSPPASFSTRAGAEEYVAKNGGTIKRTDLRDDLIFKNVDGTPKSTISGREYPLDKTSKDFSLFEKDKAAKEALSTPKDTVEVPAIKLKDGTVIKGNTGDIHADIIDRLIKSKDARAEDSLSGEKGFVTTSGQFVNRRQAADMLGEKQPLQSERLNEIRGTENKRSAPPQNFAEVPMKAPHQANIVAKLGLKDGGSMHDAVQGIINNKALVGDTAHTLAEFIMRHGENALRATDLHGNDMGKGTSFFNGDPIRPAVHLNLEHGDVVSDLLHEAAHSVWDEALRNPKSERAKAAAAEFGKLRETALKSLNPEQLKFLNEKFTPAMNEYRSSGSVDPAIMEQALETGLHGEIFYALTHPEEFHSAMFNRSSVVRSFFDEIPAEGKSVWQRGWDKIKEFFGVKQDSVLDRGFDALKNVDDSTGPVEGSSEIMKDAVRRVPPIARNFKAFIKAGPNKETMSRTLDAAENEAKIGGRQAGNWIRVSLPKLMDRKALTFAIEAGGDIAKLKAMLPKVAGNGEATAAVNHAIANIQTIGPLARRTSLQMKVQRDIENINGIDTQNHDNYIKHAYEDDPSGVLFDAGGTGVSSTFKKHRTYETYADAIKDGYKPKTFDAASLVESRIGAGLKLVNRAKWGEALGAMVDPSDGEPLSKAMIRQPGTPNRMVAPRGYSPVEVMPGVSFAIKDEYRGIFDALLGKSDVKNSALGRGALETEAAIKHGTLAYDSFHLFRMAYRQGFLTGSVGYKKGLTLLEYGDAAINEMRRKGDIDKAGYDYYQANKDKARLLAKNGYNIGRIGEALSSKLMNENIFKRTAVGAAAGAGVGAVKGGLHGAAIGAPIGAVTMATAPYANRWIFEKFTRGAMMETGVTELERVKKANPTWTNDQVAAKVAKDLNFYFGNIQRQGLLKSATKRDVAQLALLAPQWLESMAQTEARSYAGVPIDLVRSARDRAIKINTLTKGVGTGVTAMFLANQMVNQYFNHKFTWQNDEKGHKLDAHIPDPFGESDGFWLSPLSVQADLTHDFYRYSVSKSSVLQAGQQVLRNKLAPVNRAAWTMKTSTDYKGDPLLSDKSTYKSAVNDLIPQPLIVGGLASKTPGAKARQIFSSVGLKMEPVLSSDKTKRPQDVQSRFQMAERAVKNEFVRLDKVQEQIPEPAQKWLEDQRLVINPPVTGRQFVDAVKQNPEQFEKLLGTEYAKVVTDFQESAPKTDGRSTEQKQRALNVRINGAHRRAEAQLKRESSASALAPQ